MNAYSALFLKSKYLGQLGSHIKNKNLNTNSLRHLSLAQLHLPFGVSDERAPAPNLPFMPERSPAEVKALVPPVMMLPILLC